MDGTQKSIHSFYKLTNERIQCELDKNTDSQFITANLKLTALITQTSLFTHR